MTHSFFPHHLSHYLFKLTTFTKALHQLLAFLFTIKQVSDPLLISGLTKIMEEVKEGGLEGLPAETPKQLKREAEKAAKFGKFKLSDKPKKKEVAAKPKAAEVESILFNTLSCKLY